MNLRRGSARRASRFPKSVDPGLVHLGPESEGYGPLNGHRVEQNALVADIAYRDQLSRLVGLDKGSGALVGSAIVHRVMKDQHLGPWDAAIAAHDL